VAQNKCSLSSKHCKLNGTF